jgi:hypothetical protein
VVAFVFRLVVGNANAQFGGDAPQYPRLAQNLAAGHGYSYAHTAPFLASDIRLPGYPALLAVAFRFSDSRWSFFILNALLGAVATFLVWLIADGLHLNRTRALWCTAIAALWLPTATMAGTALSENLSVPAILAFVYFTLIRPPRTRLRLFVIGSLLAWLIALTREELVVFAVIVAIVAGRRAHLKALAVVGLVLCFLLGSLAWAGRNEVQVHRTELIDSVQEDAVYVASMLGGHNMLEKEAHTLLLQPTISPAARAHYQTQVFHYVKHQLSHNTAAVAASKAKYEAESIFPVPVFGITYQGTGLDAVQFLWSFLILGELILAFRTARRWWRSGRRPDVVSIFLYPVFIVLFEVIFDPQFRFVLPVNLLLLPLAVDEIGTLFAERRSHRASASEGSTGGGEPSREPAGLGSTA